MSHATHDYDPSADLLATLEQAVATPPPPVTLDEAGTRLLRRLVAEAIEADFVRLEKEMVHSFSVAVANEMNRGLTAAVADVRRAIVQHEELHHPATGPDGQLSETSAAAIMAKLESLIDAHVTNDHTYGAIGELVDFAVSERFSEYARFLISAEANGRISQVAAQVGEVPS